MTLPRPTFRARAQAAFTMVEIAICIAVVAFAMVAIIGVLPTGFQVQRENREETLIGQEGMLWLEAIRSGAMGMDYLTNHVEFIEQIEQLQGRAAETRRFSYRNGYSRGWEIVALLTQPKYVEAANGNWTVNRTRALVRSVTGSAANMTPANDFAFTYLLEVEAVPFNGFAPVQTNWQDNAISPEEQMSRSNNWSVALNQERNAWALKLSLSWPVATYANVAGGLRIGNGHREFRVLTSGVMAPPPLTNAAPAYLLQPSQFLAQ